MESGIDRACLDDATVITCDGDCPYFNLNSILLKEDVMSCSTNGSRINGSFHGPCKREFTDKSIEEYSCAVLYSRRDN